MTIKTENWLGEYTSTIGTGDITLGGAIDGFAGFSNVGENVDVYYTIMDALDKETGIGTLTGGKLVRKDIHAILVDGAYVKNGSAINLSGDAQVYGTANAHFLDYVQAVANAEIVNTQAIAELKALQINGHALTASFNLTAADVGAHPDSWMPSTEALNVYQKDASDIRYLKTQDAEQVAGLVMRVGGAREQQLQQSINDVSTAFIGDAPPAGAPVGKRWFDTESGRTYIKYNDGDSTQWIEESPQGLSPDGLESRIYEALRRSYAEAGYNLVDGSFETGGTLVSANDVLLQWATGKGFTGPSGMVSADTDPASGGFIDRSNNLLITYKTVSDMLQWAPQLPLGSRVAWDDYFAEGDCGGGRGVIKSGAHTEDGGSIFSLGETKYIEAFLPATVFSIKFGVKFDNLPFSAAHNTTRLQRFVDYVSSNYKEGVWGSGVAYYNGFTLTKSSRLRGIKSVGPEFGVRDNYVGSTLRNASQNNHAIVVDATGNTPHTGLHCIWDDFTVHGNRMVAGSVGGHNILLKADTTGEVTFIEGCQFRNIQSIYAKELGWGIQGTVFANDWWACSGANCGTHGFSRAAPGGFPVTNNLHGCKLFENAQWGVYNDGITMSLFGCNVAQNYSGGLLAKSGYVESVNCDYEQNHNVAIETRDSGGSGILVTGGKIHKSPGNLPGSVGIRAASGSSGGVVRDVLFTNFTETGDKIFESTGGSLSEFSYRLQNVTTGQLTATDMLSIERIPNLDFPRRGLVEFAGSGVGRRVATVTFSVPFKVGYTIDGSIRDAFGVNPIGSGISTSNITLASVQLAVDVTADVGPVYVDWVAIGR